MGRTGNPSTSISQSEDTASGCRDRAQADHLLAMTMDPGNQRGQMEGSARSWNARADMLDKEEHLAPTRRARLKAEWEDGEDEGVLAGATRSPELRDYDHEPA